jgi:hypothetical protein
MSTNQEPETVSALPTLAQYEDFLIRWGKRYHALPGVKDATISFSPSGEKILYRACIHDDLVPVFFTEASPAALFDRLKGYQAEKDKAVREQIAKLQDQLKGKEAA